MVDKMQYRSYKAGKDSKFFGLPGNYKRAIENQANIEVLGYQISKVHGKRFEQEEVSQKKFEEICEGYAGNENKVKALAIKDSKTFYMYPYTKDRESYYLQQASEYALKLDQAFNYLQLQQGKGRS